MPEPLSPRVTLLRHNAGLWQGTFIRLDAGGVESERFPSSLDVQERGDRVVASLTNGLTGAVRTMEFSEPPPEMQISASGHWSLGPDRIGPWPWVSELCLVQGERRRRVVVRHGADGVESVVLVSEGRPGCADPAPSPPHRAAAVDGPGGSDRVVWLLEHSPANRVELEMVRRRRFGEPQSVGLRWWPEGNGSPDRPVLEIQRRHGASGLLEVPVG